MPAVGRLWPSGDDDGDFDGDDGQKVTCDYVLTLQVQHEKLDDYQDVQDDGYQEE